MAKTKSRNINIKNRGSVVRMLCFAYFLVILNRIFSFCWTDYLKTSSWDLLDICHKFKSKQLHQKATSCIINYGKNRDKVHNKRTRRNMQISNNIKTTDMWSEKWSLSPHESQNTRCQILCVMALPLAYEEQTRYLAGGFNDGVHLYVLISLLTGYW